MSSSNPLIQRTLKNVSLLKILLIFFSPALFSAEESNEELLQQLKSRDTIIADLLRRVENLEQRSQTSVDQSKNPDSGESASTQENGQAAVAQTAVAQKNQAPQQAPGTVTVDERAADRALERTLTLQGVLLLPKGVKEFAPYTAYARRESSFPEILTFDDVTTVGSQRVERDEFSLGIRGAIGLPFDSQLEFNIPYRYVNETRTSTFTGAPLGDSSEYGTSIGDIQIGIAKTLLREDGWKPDLLGRLTWNSDSGDVIDNGIPLGQGFNDFRLSFTALKRQDPLAFNATVSYQHSLEKDNLQPGDEFGLTLGASMATSPSTSLSIALAQSFQQDFKIDGRSADGTSGDSALLLFGASSILGRQTLLAVSAGIGLNRAAPDYTLSFSLPIRFW